MRHFVRWSLLLVLSVESSGCGDDAERSGSADAGAADTSTPNSDAAREGDASAARFDSGLAPFDPRSGPPAGNPDGNAAVPDEAGAVDTSSPTSSLAKQCNPSAQIPCSSPHDSPTYRSG